MLCIEKKILRAVFVHVKEQVQGNDFPVMLSASRPAWDLLSECLFSLKTQMQSVCGLKMKKKKKLSNPSQPKHLLLAWIHKIHTFVNFPVTEHRVRKMLRDRYVYM